MSRESTTNGGNAVSEGTDTRAEDERMLYDREQRVTDPVCGMSFKVERAAARAEYEGKTYYFCAHACHRQFHGRACEIHWRERD